MSGTRSPIARVAGAVAAAVVALGTLTACGGGPGVVPGSVADDSWTVMTYMIADTNLEYFQMEDMAEQEAVGSRPGFNLISYLDRSADYSEDDVIGIPNWSGAKVIEVRQAGGSTVLTEEGDVNTGDPAVLAEFISRTITAYPAAHYALIINDHGSSWPGIGADGSADNDQLTLAELHEGVTAGLDGGGLDKLDLIGFDACLMATYETASTVQDVASRMLASQELEPGYGWNYTALETAARGGTVDELADSIIKAYDEQSLEQGEAQVTLSLTDLTKMPAVDEAVDAFAQALMGGVTDLAPTVGRTLAQNLAFGSTPDYDFYMTDLGMLAGQIGADASEVAGAADAVTQAISAAVTNKVDGQATRGASGMAIYFPPQAAAFNDEYTGVGVASVWTEFLQAYYDAGAAGGTPQFASPQAQSQFANGGFVIGQQVVSDVNQVTDVYIRYGYVEADGSVTLIGDEPASIDADGFAVGFFDTYQLWIGDGSSEESFYSSYSVNQESGVATIGVPIAYFLPGDSQGSQAFLQMSYEPSTGTILSQTFYGYDPDAAAFSEISLVDGSTFSPLKISLGADGSETLFLASQVGIDTNPDNLAFGYRQLDSGTLLYAELTIESGTGELATTTATGTLP